MTGTNQHTMTFGYTILYVRDVATTVSFYERAFGLARRFIVEDESYAEMETGSTALAFASINLALSNLPQGFEENSLSKPPAGIEIGFVADDVQAAFETAVQAGATAVSAPRTKPWGQTVAYVRDLDGILIELASKMG